MDKNVEIEESIYQEIYENLMHCIRAKSALVRLIALASVFPFQNPTNPECAVIKEKDPNYKIRLKILTLIIPCKFTLPSILSRCKDINLVVRKTAYSIIIDKIPLKYLTIKQRIFFLKCIFNENKVSLRDDYSNRLLNSWLSHTQNNVLKLISLLDIEFSDDIGAYLLSIYFKKYLPSLNCSTFQNDFAKCIEILISQLLIDKKTHLIKTIVKDGFIQYLPSFSNEDYNMKDNTNEPTSINDINNQQDCCCLLSEAIFYYNYLFNKIHRYVHNYEEMSGYVTQNSTLFKSRYIDMIAPNDPATFIDFFERYIETTFKISTEISHKNNHSHDNDSATAAPLTEEQFILANTKANFIVRQCLVTLYLIDITEIAAKKKLIKSLKNIIPKLFSIPVTCVFEQGEHVKSEPRFYLTDKTCCDLIRTFVMFNTSTDSNTTLVSPSSLSSPDGKSKDNCFSLLLASPAANPLGLEGQDQEVLEESTITGMETMSTHDLSVCDEIVNFRVNLDDDETQFEEQGDIIWKPENFKGRSSEKIDGRMQNGNRNSTSINNEGRGARRTSNDIILTDFFEIISEILDPLEGTIVDPEIAAMSQPKFPALSQELDIYRDPFIIYRVLLLLKEALKIIVELRDTTSPDVALESITASTCGTNDSRSRYNVFPNSNIISSNLELFKPLYADIIIPGLSWKDNNENTSCTTAGLSPMKLRAKSLECLALLSYLDTQTAHQNYAIFIEAFKMDVLPIKLVALKAAFDLILLYPGIEKQILKIPTNVREESEDLGELIDNSQATIGANMIGIPFESILPFLEHQLYTKSMEQAMTDENYSRSNVNYSTCITSELFKGLCKLYLFQRCADPTLLKLLILNSVILENIQSPSATNVVYNNYLNLAKTINRFLEIYTFSSKLNQMFVTKVNFDILRELACQALPENVREFVSTTIITCIQNVTNIVPTVPSVDKVSQDSYLANIPNGIWGKEISQNIESMLQKILVLSDYHQFGGTNVSKSVVAATSPVTTNDEELLKNVETLNAPDINQNNSIPTPFFDNNEVSPHGYLADRLTELLLKIYNVSNNLDPCDNIKMSLEGDEDRLSSASSSSTAHNTLLSSTRLTHNNLNQENASLSIVKVNGLEYFIEDKSILRALLKFLACLNLGTEPSFLIQTLKQALEIGCNLDTFRDKMAKKWLMKFQDNLQNILNARNNTHKS